MAFLVSFGHFHNFSVQNFRGTYLVKKAKLLNKQRLAMAMKNMKISKQEKSNESISQSVFDMNVTILKYFRYWYGLTKFQSDINLLISNLARIWCRRNCGKLVKFQPLPISCFRFVMVGPKNPTQPTVILA